MVDTTTTNRCAASRSACPRNPGTGESAHEAHAPILYQRLSATCRRVGACGQTSCHQTSPTRSSTANEHPQPPTFPIRPLEQCLSKLFGSNSHSSQSFYLCFFIPSTFINIQRCFVVTRSKILSMVVFLHGFVLQT